MNTKKYKKIVRIRRYSTPSLNPIKQKYKRGRKDPVGRTSKLNRQVIDKVVSPEMKVINLTPHDINFVDGRVIPSDVPGTTDAERIANAPKLVAKDPTSTEEDRLLEDGTLVHV